MRASNSSSSCSVGLTTSLTGGTITNFATQLASLLDTGQNSTLGSGGTHFENALNTMNRTSFRTPSGPERRPAPCPILFIVTDGSQDYQTQSERQLELAELSLDGNRSLCEFGDRHSAEQRHQHGLLHDDEKSRDNDRDSLYPLPDTFSNANSNFANNEDGYANNNIANIPRRAADMRVDELLLHRQYADRHPERADRDVPAGCEHGTRLELSLRSPARPVGPPPGLAPCGLANELNYFSLDHLAEADRRRPRAQSPRPLSKPWPFSIQMWHQRLGRRRNGSAELRWRSRDVAHPRTATHTRDVQFCRKIVRLSRSYRSPGHRVCRSCSAESYRDYRKNSAIRRQSIRTTA